MPAESDRKGVWVTDEEAANIAGYLFELAVGKFGIKPETAAGMMSEFYALQRQCGVVARWDGAARIAEQGEETRVDMLAEITESLSADLDLARSQLESAQRELRIAVEELRHARATLPDEPQPPDVTSPVAMPTDTPPVPSKKAHARRPLGEIEPVRPTADDDEMFVAVRRLGAAASYGDIARALGREHISSIYQRMNVLENYRQIPDDIAAWRQQRKNSRTTLRVLAATADWTPLCMPDDEYREWVDLNRDAASGKVPAPCLDCPASFAAEMRIAEKCNGEPGVGPLVVVPA